MRRRGLQRGDHARRCVTVTIWTFGGHPVHPNRWYYGPTHVEADEEMARKMADAGVPCFGCTPNKLPELIEGVLKKQDLKALAARIATKKNPNG